MSQQIQYGVQLFSLRDITKNDFEGALAGAAALGYRYVEPCGYMGHSAETVKSWLEKYGLEVKSVHVALDRLLPENIEETIAFHKTLGCNYIIIQWLDTKTAERMEENIKVINHAYEVLKKEGMTLAFHNHSGDHIETDYGIVPFEELAKRTKIEFQIDVFLAYAGGADPFELFDRYRDRISVIHLKDGICAQNTPDNKAVGKALGEGETPIAAIRDLALERGIFMVVESGGLSPTGLEEVGRCIAYLRSLEK